MPEGFRHEYKYLINEQDHLVIRSRLNGVLQKDKNTPGEDYFIRSLYFDDIKDSALTDKIDGMEEREKYRIRIYNNSPDVIKFECKQKHGNAVRKLSAPLTRRECEALLAGDHTVLYGREEPLLQKFIADCNIKRLLPTQLVDYDREAFISYAGNVRVTFDKNLMAPVSKTGLFDAKQPRVAVFPQGVLIMEVKYDGFLPDHISELIQLGCREAQANSKYVLCRAAAGR